jgi:hypothetical protein
MVPRSRSRCGGCKATRVLLPADLLARRADDAPVTGQAPVNLTSGDVVHAFWVPEFLFRRHVIPGHPNRFAITATQAGTFTGALQRVVRPFTTAGCCLG